MIEVAADFELPSIAGGPVKLSRLFSDGPAPARVLLLFAHEDCPTSLLALSRLAPLGAQLDTAGTRLVCVLQDPPEIAARLARRYGITGTVLVEPPPYEATSAYGVETVPTAVLVGADLTVQGAVIGWSKTDLDRLLPIEVTDAEPRWKPGCQARNTYDPALLAASGDAFDELEDMFERGWTDGLPVIPPTRARVEAMLDGRDPSRSLGEVPPAMGEATLERVAACAVLAGCRPEYFPVVLAAVEAILDPAFNVNGQAVTTSAPGQVVVVNGPVRQAIGLNSGMGALSSGYRPNMTIGRAVRLVVHLTGRGAPGGLDRATLGHPGKLGFCVAEHEEASPWEPLHVERGFSAESSTVTVLPGDSPLSISDHRSRTPEELAATLGCAAATGWSPFMWPMDATSLFVIGPEHAALFREAGWEKEQVRRAIFEAVQRPARELRRGETTPTVLHAPDDEAIHKWTSPERIMIIVAGADAGRFSAVVGPSLGMDASVLTREVAWNT